MFVQLIVYIYIKLKHERLAQKIPVACGKVAALEDKVVLVSVRCSLPLAKPPTLSAHRNTPFTSCA
jgi:hypothetical protein